MRYLLGWTQLGRIQGHPETAQEPLPVLLVQSAPVAGRQDCLLKLETFIRTSAMLRDLNKCCHDPVLFLVPLTFTDTASWSSEMLRGENDVYSCCEQTALAVATF